MQKLLFNQASLVPLVPSVLKDVQAPLDSRARKERKVPVIRDQQEFPDNLVSQVKRVLRDHLGKVSHCFFSSSF